MLAALRPRRLVLVLGAAAAAIACRADDVSAPPARIGAAAADGGRSAVGAPDAGGPASWGWSRAVPVVCRPRSRQSVSRLVGPQGGTIVIGDSRLRIPRGALRGPVTITASIAGDATSTVHFQPAGLRFALPAELTLSARGCRVPPAGSARIVYVGPHGEVLETLPARYDAWARTATGPIEHFSGYAIAFKE